MTLVRNPLLAPPDPLTPEAVARIDAAWRGLVADVGVRFDDPEAIALLREAGQRADDDGVVRLDPAFVAEQVARAPSAFDVGSLPCGRGATSFTAAYGAPFVLEGGTRREATMADFERLVALVDMLGELDSPGGVICEPGDRPIDSRHLDMQRALLLGTAKTHFAAVISGVAAADSVALAALAHGGAEALARSPQLLGIVNANSPLVWDTRMLEAMLTLSRAGQVPIITPAVMMGGLAPVTMAAALAQWLAEAFAAIALCQLARPGVPVLLGSGVVPLDLRRGSLSYGAPEAALGLLVSGQLARHYRLPWRALGGGLTSSPVPDAQAGYESALMLQCAVAAGADLVVHAAGWLEGGLVTGYEKLLLDADHVAVLAAMHAPIAVDDEAFTLSSYLEVGPGGHFLATDHTLARFRDCFHVPRVTTTDNVERWQRDGGLTAAERAGRLLDGIAERYRPPAIDDAVRAAVDEYVARRRRELGDA